MAAKPVSMGLEGHDDDDDDDFFFPNAGIVVLEFLDIIYGWGLIDPFSTFVVVYLVAM